MQKPEEVIDYYFPTENLSRKGLVDPFLIGTFQTYSTSGGHYFIFTYYLRVNVWLGKSRGGPSKGLDTPGEQTAEKC